MDPAALRTLLKPDGWELLNSLPPYDERTLLTTSERLRRLGVDPTLIAAALTQSQLRAAARQKFGPFAAGMLFTRAGLEQATRLEVATVHAQRYLAAGCTHIGDVTCGIGADAMAFAGVGLSVLATDIDEVTAAIASVNLRHFANATVQHRDGLSVDPVEAGLDGIYADPARRTTTGTRIFNPEAYAPPLTQVWEIRHRIPAVGIKVGPGIPHHGLPEEAETQWVSLNGDVVEAGLWFGPLASNGPGRTALILRHIQGEDRDQLTSHTVTSLHDAAPHTPTIGSYLCEPDGAVIRAGLVATAAHHLDGWLLDPTIAYITTNHHITPDANGLVQGLATGYRVLDTMPFHLKRLRTYLKERKIGRLTIKKRGTAVLPEQLRRQLALRGDEEATIVLTRIAGSQHVLVVDPLQKAL